MKKHYKKIIATVAVATVIAGGAYLTQSQVPQGMYPNPLFTQGKADTLNASELQATYYGQTYSQSHRNVNQAEHTQVYDEYNVPQNQRNIQNGEIDHLYPLCAGGSNDISNLWYQPINVIYKGQNVGFKLKDRLETWVCVQIKANRITPQDAFENITKDWYAYYLQNKNAIEGTQRFGSLQDNYVE